MNCPKCGAEGTLLRSHSVGLYYDFDCGSSTVCEGEEFEQSGPCRELCDLRKWREVVLKNVFVDWSDYDPRHWAVDLECDKSIPLLNVGDNPAEAFDAAVRKEMECES